MGALEAPQDRHGQEHRTGTSRAEQTDKGGHGGAVSSGGHGGAGSSGSHGRWSLWPWPRSPRPGPYSQNPFTPPKNFPGEVRGYQEPSGARHRQTGQDIPQEPLPPPRQGGQAARMASMATTRGAACPRRVSLDKTR